MAAVLDCMTMPLPDRRHHADVPDITDTENVERPARAQRSARDRRPDEGRFSSTTCRTNYARRYTIIGFAHFLSDR